MDIFETLVAKISAANDLYQTDNPVTNQSFYLKEKVPESSKIYHNNYNEYKSKKILERELKRPWTKLSTNYKIMVILDFLKQFEKSNLGINLNLVRFDTLLNIEKNKGLELKIDYDNLNGKLKKLYGYKIIDKKVVKSDNQNDYLVNKIKLKLKLKVL